MSEPRVFAAAGHRCAATISSTGGERTYPWASAPSTWENVPCVLEWTRADWGADHVFTSCSCTSGKKGTDALESALRVDLKYHESSLLLTSRSAQCPQSDSSSAASAQILQTVAITNSTGEVEDSDVIVVGIAFILSRARHICMLCDNWPVIWTGVSQ